MDASPPRLFGTDGIRGTVGETLTPDKVAQIGKAAALWAQGGRIFIARDTRYSSVDLEGAFALGVKAGGGCAVLANVLPTPAAAIFAQDLGVVITASHNPAQYNGVKLFASNGRRLTKAEETEIETLVNARAPQGGSFELAEPAVEENYSLFLIERFGLDLSGYRIAIDCANGSCYRVAPDIFTRLGAEVITVADAPDGHNINDGCGTGYPALLSQAVLEKACDFGFSFDGDGDRLLAIDAGGKQLDADRITAIIALNQGVDKVVVTQMTSLAFRRGMHAAGIPVYVSDVGDRAVIDMMKQEGAVIGGGHPGHIIDLARHVTSDSIASALLLCRALKGKTLAEAGDIMPSYSQIEGVVPAIRPLPLSVGAEIGALNRYLRDDTRVVARASGTEPVIRLLAEAPTKQLAEGLYARLEAMVVGGLGKA